MNGQIDFKNKEYQVDIVAIHILEYVELSYIMSNNISM